MFLLFFSKTGKVSVLCSSTVHFFCFLLTLIVTVVLHNRKKFTFFNLMLDFFFFFVLPVQSGTYFLRDILLFVGSHSGESGGNLNLGLFCVTLVVQTWLQ